MYTKNLKLSHYMPRRSLGERSIARTHSRPRHLMGVNGQRHAPGRALATGKGPPVPIVQEAGWAPEPVWTQSSLTKCVDTRSKNVIIRRSAMYVRIAPTR
jgi:hypothetical protein